MATGEPSPEPAIPEIDLGPIGPKARYEFTPSQADLIADLARKMGFVGGFLLVLAAIIFAQVITKFIASRYFDVYGTISSLVFGLIGFWTLSASGGFSAVVRTVGWDVPHLMDALGSLRRMYSLLYSFLVAAIIASLVLLFTNRAR